MNLAGGAQRNRRSVRCAGSPFLCLVSGKRGGPAALCFDHLVNLAHQADRLIQGDDDLLVVLDVFVGHGAALAVLEPLLADLVAADVESSRLPPARRRSTGSG